MRLHRALFTGMLGVFLLVGSAFAQNIDTQTTSTTIGSTTFGYLPTSADLEIFMNAGAGTMTCVLAAGINTCTPTVGNDLENSYVRLPGMPGSFTDSPIAGTVSTTANFACGASVLRGDDCNANMGDRSVNTTDPFGQTIPTASNSRDLVGTLSLAIALGDGTTVGMPSGFINFSLDPSVAAGTEFDQLIDSNISLGVAGDMRFQQRDATIGAAGTLVLADLDAATPTTLTLVPFTSPATIAGNGMTGVGMVSRSLITQPDAAFGGATPFVTDVSVVFNGGGGQPANGQFIIPGLATGGTLAAPTFDFP